MKDLYGYLCPPIGADDLPATERQVEAIWQNREWRQLTGDVFVELLRIVLSAHGAKSADVLQLSRSQASCLIEYFKSASFRTKHLVEQCAMANVAGQQELF